MHPPFVKCVPLDELWQVIYPADRNGVVGLKPTVGSTSGRGIIPESRNLDVVGPTAKTVADAAVVTSVIMGQTLEDGPGMIPAGNEVLRY